LRFRFQRRISAGFENDTPAQRVARIRTLTPTAPTAGRHPPSMLRFSANLSILFKEAPFLERFSRAAQAGFSAVEFWWPTGEDPEAVVAAVEGASVQVAAFNFDAGDMAAGDRGLVGDPERTASFRDHVPVALDLARRLDCTRMNALMGLRRDDWSHSEQLEIARETVAWTAERAKSVGVTVLIEAINTMENGPYLLSTTREAAAFVRSLDRSNVKLQYDVYHMQRMEGNLVATLREHIGEIGHVQVADSPDRGEPGTGEIRFDYFFQQLEALGYDGYVGLEYRPSAGDTIASLDWLPEEARRSGTTAAALSRTLGGRSI